MPLTSKSDFFVQVQKVIFVMFKVFIIILNICCVSAFRDFLKINQFNHTVRSNELKTKDEFINHFQAQLLILNKTIQLVDRNSTDQANCEARPTLVDLTKLTPLNDNEIIFPQMITINRCGGTCRPRNILSCKSTKSINRTITAIKFV